MRRSLKGLKGLLPEIGEALRGRQAGPAREAGDKGVVEQSRAGGYFADNSILEQVKACADENECASLIYGDYIV